MPVVSVAPTVDFVTPSFGGRKPITSVESTAEKLIPVELAATLAIPDAFIDDSGFPVWDSVQSELAKASAKKLDQAILFGADAPAEFPAGGLVALAGAAQTGTTAEEAIDLALGKVEAAGVRPSGIATGLAINSQLRKAQIASSMGPVVSEAAPMLFGLLLQTTVHWIATAGDACVGDFGMLLIGIREDVGFDLSTDGVLVDGAGAIQVSAFHDDMTLLRSTSGSPARGRAAGRASGDGDRAVLLRRLDDAARRSGVEPGEGEVSDEDAELEVALRRSQALGRPVIVVGFAEADSVTLFDLDEDGEPVPVCSMPVTPRPPGRE